MFGGPKVQDPAAVIRQPTLLGATRSEPSGDNVIWVSSQVWIAPGFAAEYCVNAESLLSNAASIAASIVERGVGGGGGEGGGGEGVAKGSAMFLPIPL
jgi:hypothetical protein